MKETTAFTDFAENNDDVDADADSQQVDSRTRKALEGVMAVTPEMPEVADNDDEVLVTSTSSYVVNVARGTCECPDHQHRDTRCKHIRRAEYVTGKTPIPVGAAMVCDIDPDLGQHTDADPEIDVAA